MNYGKWHAIPSMALLIGGICGPLLHAQERQIDPTFLYRDTSTAKEKPSDITTATCHYKPLFGQGDPDTSVVVGIARYGGAVMYPKGLGPQPQSPSEHQ